MSRFALLFLLLAGCGADVPITPPAGKAATDLFTLLAEGKAVIAQDVQPPEPDTTFNIQLNFIHVDVDASMEEEEAYYHSLGFRWDAASKQRSYESLLEGYGGAHPFTDRDKEIIRRAANRWENVITQGFQDTLVMAMPSPINSVPSRVEVDDIYIHVIAAPPRGKDGGYGGPITWRPNTTIPLVGSVGISWREATHSDFEIEQLVLHEIGHALGLIGWKSHSHKDYWERPVFRKYFGRFYYITWATHFAHISHGDDVMKSTWYYGISQISLAMLADLGYSVDMDAAENHHGIY